MISSVNIIASFAFLRLSHGHILSVSRDVLFGSIDCYQDFSIFAIRIRVT